MTNQPTPKEQDPAQKNSKDKTPKENKGKQTELQGAVNLWGTIAITLYVLIITLVFFYALLAFWPADISNASQDSQTASVSFFGATFNVYGEVRMLILIGLIGAIGAQVRSLRSLSWYIGNRELTWSWLVLYIVAPCIGAMLGSIFYFVIRAGFFSPSASIENSNPIGFIALAALAGMFSEQAVLKLKDVAETLLAKPAAGRDSKPQGDDEGEGEEEPPTNDQETDDNEHSGGEDTPKNDVTSPEEQTP
jgi:hypothetical protein